MKKLFVMMAVVVAAACAKADLYLYWAVTEADFGANNYAKLYMASSNTRSSSDTLLSTVKGTLGYIPTQSTDVESIASTSYFYIILGDTLGEQSISKIMAYSALKSDSMGDTPTAANVKTAWTGSGFQQVPEPTSGLLLLVGAAMLALKRRRA